MSFITIEAADGSGDTRQVSQESWKRWPQAKDATGKVIDGHRRWGKRNAFIQGSEHQPRPIPKVPVVPKEVAAQLSDPNAIDTMVEVDIKAAPDPIPAPVSKPERGKPGPKPKNR